MKKNMTPRLPNFLLVGANRCGTTSLYYYLKEHPEVHMSSIKEPSFFLSLSFKVPEQGIGDDRREFVTDFNDYCRLFETAGDCKALGEASTENLYHYDKVIPDIKRLLGNPKILISLRNPVERAFSAYTYLISENREFLTFEEGLSQEEKRMRDGWRQIWFYKDAGFYSARVKAYLENFDEVKICLFDDLIVNPLSFVQEVYKFLGVDPSYKPDVKARYKTSGIPRSKKINRLFEEPTRLRSVARAVGKFVLKEDGWTKVRDALKAKSYARAEMKPETRIYLERVYREDILKLEDVIQRDLSAWLKPRNPGGE
jgi:hypothetical protein